MAGFLLNRFRFIVAAYLVLVSPLLLYLKYSEYPFFTLEGLFAYTAIFLISIVVGLVFSIDRPVFRVSVAVALLLYFFLTRFPEHFPTFGYLGFNEVKTLMLIITILALTSVLFLKNIEKLIIVVFGALAFSTLALGMVDGSSKQNEVGDIVGKSELPPYVHFVLDEHIGVEGLPLLRDKGLMQTISDDYLSLGFAVHARAYSTHADTMNSFQTFLNFRSPGLKGNSMNNLVDGKLTENRVFDLLESKGYEISVFQSGYIDLCQNRKSLKRCTTSSYDAMSHLLPVSAWDKFLLLMNANLYRGRIYLFFRYSAEFLTRIGIPTSAWNMSDEVSSLTSFANLQKVQKLMDSVKPGNAYFIHILLPHKPYVLDRDCAISLDQLTVSQTSKPELDIELYINQVACTHKNIFPMVAELVDRFPSSIVNIHGDHGARVTKFKPIAPNHDLLSPSDIVNSFSTLFLCKSSSCNQGYIRAPASLKALLAKSLEKDFDLDVEDNAGTDFFSVYLLDESSRDKPKNILHQISMPPFSYGTPTSDWGN